MTMQTIGFVLICLACAGYGFRMPARRENTNDKSREEQSLETLASLLSGLSPLAGFTQAGQGGARSHAVVRPPASVVSPVSKDFTSLSHQQQRSFTPRMTVNSGCTMASRRSRLQQAGVSVAAALIAGNPFVAHADYGDDFDMDACLKRFKNAPNICTVKKGGAKAAAQNEARKARVAQCDADKEAKQKNNGVLPASVQPATKNPNEPASCVGAPTYQLTGCGDPSLPVIYCQDGK